MSKSLKRNFIIGTILVVIVLLSAYIGMAIYFGSHFYNGSIINGIDVSGQTVEEIEDTIADDTRDYLLTVFSRTGDKELILGSEIDMTYVSSGEIQKRMDEQNNFLWFLHLGNNDDYNMTVKTTYNTEKLKARVNELALFKEENIEEPQSAYIEHIDGEYVIIDEVPGNKADPELVYEIIKEAIDNSEAAVNLAEYNDIYVQPARTADDPELLAEIESLNEFLSFTITYEFGDRTEELTGETIQEWISTDENGEVTVNYDAAFNYVEQLAMKYNTFGASRTITSSTLGTPITVTGGSYGWGINKDAETEALIETIKSGESTSREPIYAFKAMHREEDDVGDTYVEIDITEQKLFYYLNGVLTVESDIVSGTMGSHDTETGTWPVMWKKQDTYLVGETWNNKVAYFIPFYENVGLHDASWRSSFGGDIYRYSGSHGCINMPKDKVATIYETIQEGMPVFVYKH